jgi:hypothetical protein
MIPAFPVEIGLLATKTISGNGNKSPSKSSSEIWLLNYHSYIHFPDFELFPLADWIIIIVRWWLRKSIK